MKKNIINLNKLPNFLFRNCDLKEAKIKTSIKNKYIQRILSLFNLIKELYYINIEN